jgi:tagatose 1,6-diphosphate aldolase
VGQPAGRERCRGMGILTGLGTVRGLDACATRGGVFAILALDHRQNLRRELRPKDPTSVSDQELIDFKLAAVRHLAGFASATLIDPEFGLGPSILEHALPGSAGLIVAVEKTGYRGTSRDRRSRLLTEWSVAKAKRAGASAAKLLVYYHPAAVSAHHQERLVAAVHNACRRVDLPLFLEVLTFSPTTGDQLLGNERRDVLIESAARLSNIGGDVLKVGFPVDPAEPDRQRWESACRDLDAATAIPWVLLSAGVGHDLFLEQVGVACHAGASGVVAGRSIWAASAACDAQERDRYLSGESAQRMSALVELVERLASPWTRPRPPTSSRP